MKNILSLCLLVTLAFSLPRLVFAQPKEEVQKYGREGMEATKSKNWPKAIAAFKRVAELQPTSQNHENLGLAYMGAGNLGEALKSFGAAIAADAENVSAYQNRASVFYKQKRYDEAIADCTEVLNRKADNWNAKRLRAAAELGKSDWKAAFDDYSAILNANHNDAEALEGRAYALMQTKDYDKAIADYSDVIRLKPKNAHGYMKRRYLYELKGDLPKAIADCEQALKLDPKDQEAQTSLKAMKSKQSQAPSAGQPSAAPAHTP